MDAVERRHAVNAISQRRELARYLDGMETGMIVALELMGLPNRPIEPEEVKDANTIRRRMLLDILQAEICLATDDVCEVLKASYESYPTTQVFLSDVLMPVGLLYLTTPINDTRLTAYDQRLRALMWSIADMGLGEYVLTLIGLADSDTLPFAPTRRGTVPKLYPFTSVLWKLEEKDGGVFFTGDLAEEARVHRVPYIKLLLSYWAIVRQRLAQSEENRIKLDGRERKEARKANGKTHDRIHVYRIRKRSTETSSDRSQPTGRKLTKRVVVRSFWRNQWYPKTQEHKPKLILSYVKGPDGAPISGAERAYLPPKPIK